MDERIIIETRRMRDGSYRSRVFTNGDFFAEVRCNNKETSIRGGWHYCAQIEFDEDGRW